jgi:hypothetical protein
MSAAVFVFSMLLAPAARRLPGENRGSGPTHAVTVLAGAEAWSPSRFQKLSLATKLKNRIAPAEPTADTTFPKFVFVGSVLGLL